MTIGSIQPAHSTVAHEFKAEDCLGFTDSVKSTSSDFFKGTEAEGPPGEPHADDHRH
jgi:hypothetical protein